MENFFAFRIEKNGKKILHPKNKKMLRIKKIASKSKEKKVWVKNLVGKKN